MTKCIPYINNPGETLHQDQIDGFIGLGTFNGWLLTVEVGNEKRVFQLNRWIEASLLAANSCLIFSDTYEKVHVSTNLYVSGPLSSMRDGVEKSFLNMIEGGCNETMRDP